MKRFEDADVLLKEAERQLQEVSQLYKESLVEEKINPRIGVLIKNFFENIRSSLDYSSKEICEKVLNYQGETGFPISSETKDRFEKFVDQKFPNLKQKYPKLYEVHEKFQKYNPDGLRLLPILAKLVNENKHDQLSHQTKIERRTLEIKFPGGASIIMGHGTSISGGGVLSSGGAWICSAGGTISPESPVKVGQGIQQHVTTWISFRFKSIDREVMEVLQGSLDEAKLVIGKVKPFFAQKP